MTDAQRLLLQAKTDDQLMHSMRRAYSHQAHVVDNGGSDDQSWNAERRCEAVEAEIERRGLDYFAWEDAEQQRANDRPACRKCIGTGAVHASELSPGDVPVDLDANGICRCDRCEGSGNMPVVAISRLAGDDAAAPENQS